MDTSKQDTEVKRVVRKRPARAPAVTAAPEIEPAPGEAVEPGSAVGKRSKRQPVAVKAPSPKPKKPAAKASAASSRTKAEAPASVATRKPRRAPPKVEPPIEEQVRAAVVARLDAMKANDLKLIDVRDKTSVTDFLVIASGTSTRHVKSMGDEVVVTAKKFGLPPIGVEGEREAEWILVDLGDTIVHVMLPRTREFYGLERLWTVAEESRAAAAG